MKLSKLEQWLFLPVIFLSIILSTTASSNFEIHMINVGQGDAIFIKSPDNKHMLIDCGNNGKGDDVTNYLKSINVNHIDYLIASHYHADHIGGCDEIINNNEITVDVVYDRGQSYTTQTFQDYVDAAGSKRTVIGDQVDMGSSINVNVLQKDYSNDENDKSIVVKITFNDLDFLSGGDCTEECELNLINTNSPGDIEIYKVHHHGSKYSSSQQFLDVILPEVSLIPVGKNSYGHPSRETLLRLKRIGSKVYRTDENGNIIVSSDDGVSYSITLSSQGVKKGNK